ncbi:MAG: glycosyltransferase [Desulfobacca sp.]|uniref:glycosyltransferase n=1 Tax=Desulfobacca sp. TaxID=2067990 RepID=UPI0040492E58
MVHEKKTATGASIRLMVIQFGDYRQALSAREHGRPETYRAQYYSMACFEKLLQRGEGLIVCLDTDPYDETWHNFRLVGGHFIPRGRRGGYVVQAWRASRRLIHLAQTFTPTHLIIRTPDWPMLFVGSWALRQQLPVLPLFADYFYSDSRKAKLKNFPLIRLLNRPGIPIVANHNYPACTSMVKAGVDLRKVVPYDWPASRHPREAPPKELPVADGPYRLCYAGQLSYQKGLGDLLEAVALLNSKNPLVTLDVFGNGPDKDELQKRAQHLGLAPWVRFHGLTANDKVLAAMRAAQLVVVPSRHQYPEGIPCVIYEALEVRTPVVLSDHPSFLPKFQTGQGCLWFRAGDAAHLAASLRTALSDPELYRQLSRSTEAAWEEIQCPITFGQLLEDWVAYTQGQGELVFIQKPSWCTPTSRKDEPRFELRI